MSLLNVTPVDKAFYEKELRPWLPKRIIDCHTHIWLKEHVTGVDDALRSCAWPQMVAEDNSIEDLNETNRLLFPDNEVIPVLYSHAIVTVDLSQSNPYVRQSAARFGYPSLYLAHPGEPAEQVERNVIEGGFSGLKVYLEFAPSYLPKNEIRVFDFLTHEHLALCNRHGWVVQLHIPRPRRLADPVNYYQMLEIEEKYPDLQLLIAHLGRAYADEDIGDALEALKDTKRMVWDFTANTNQNVMERILAAFGPERVIYGSDFPIFRMKARRVVENGYYINEIPKGSLGDVSTDPHMREIDGADGESITFFIYEEIASCIRAANRLGLSKADLEKIFFGNSARIFGVK